MTTLNLSLSSTLQATLGQPGVWAYAVFFKSGTTNWTELVFDGEIEDLPPGGIQLSSDTDAYSGGKVYFLAQSQAPGAKPDFLLYDKKDPSKSLITQESDINCANADTWDARYDSIAVTLANSPNDAGNLTSVNCFGLPMELSVSYTDGTTATRGYKDSTSGSDLFDEFETMATKMRSIPTTQALSPAEAISQASADPPFETSDWKDYIDTLVVADIGVALAGISTVRRMPTGSGTTAYFIPTA